MRDYVKFLRKLPKHLRERVVMVVLKIAENDLKNLDIKSLSGKGQFYRCRVGKVRIIFERRETINIIYHVGFRGDVYKKM